MRTHRIALLVGAIGLPALAGCSAREARWTGEAARHSVYATQVPLYPGAKLEQVMDSDRYDHAPDPFSEGRTWWFVVPDSPDEVAAWYEARLPEAVRTTDARGDVVFTIAPKGAEPGEHAGVTIQDGKIVVFERTRGGKHPDA
jgi:hypothetical protein